MKRVFQAAVVLPILALTYACGAMGKDDMGAMSMKPESTAVSGIPASALYVVNGAGRSISVIDPASAEVKATIALKNVDFPHHVSLSPDGKRLAVAAPGIDLSMGHGDAAMPSDTMPAGHGSKHGAMSMLTQTMPATKAAILVLDSATGGTIVARQLDQPNHNAIFSPDGSEIWTSSMAESGGVLVLDALTLATKATIPVGKMPAEVTFSLDGTLAFVANGGSDNVSVINVASRAVTGTVAVAKDPVGAWRGSDGIMYVDNEEAKSISAIDPKTSTVVRTYDLKFTPAMAATAPDGTLWVTDAEHGSVVLFKAGAIDKVTEIVLASGTHGISFSNDGKTAYLTNQGADSVSVVDVA